jgi:hypothetical protein
VAVVVGIAVAGSEEVEIGTATTAPTASPKVAAAMQTSRETVQKRSLILRKSVGLETTTSHNNPNQSKFFWLSLKHAWLNKGGFLPLPPDLKI